MSSWVHRLYHFFFPFFFGRGHLLISKASAFRLSLLKLPIISFFPSDTLHCLGLKLWVLAEEIFWLKRVEMSKSIILKTDRREGRKGDFDILKREKKQNKKRLKSYFFFLTATHIPHRKTLQSSQDASNTSTWTEDQAKDRMEQKERKKAVKSKHLSCLYLKWSALFGELFFFSPLLICNPSSSLFHHDKKKRQDFGFLETDAYKQL